MNRRSLLLSLLTPFFVAVKAKAGVIFHEETKEAAQVPEKRVLHFYGPAWCPACPAKLETVKKELGEKFEIRVHKDYDNYPAWLLAQGQEAGWGYPMVHWTNQSGISKVMVWMNVTDFHKQDSDQKKLPQGRRPVSIPFVQPDQQGSRAVARSPVYSPGHNCPNCGTTQFHIENDAGPNHTHRCTSCNTVWYHADQSRSFLSWF